MNLEELCHHRVTGSTCRQRHGRWLAKCCCKCKKWPLNLPRAGSNGCPESLWFSNGNKLPCHKWPHKFQSNIRRRRFSRIPILCIRSICPFYSRLGGHHLWKGHMNSPSQKESRIESFGSCPILSCRFPCPKVDNWWTAKSHDCSFASADDSSAISMNLEPWNKGKPRFRQRSRDFRPGMQGEV